jgi:hypothetical protein
MTKRVEWDWEGQLTPGERELLEAITSKQNALDVQFNLLEQDMAALDAERGRIVRAAGDRARAAGVKRVPFKL